MTIKTIIEIAGAVKEIAGLAIDLKQLYDTHFSKITKLEVTPKAEKEKLTLLISGGAIETTTEATFKATTSSVTKDAEGPIIRPLWEWKVELKAQESTGESDRIFMQISARHLATPHGEPEALIPLKISFGVTAENSARQLKQGSDDLYTLKLSGAALGNIGRNEPHGEHFDVVTAEIFEATIDDTMIDQFAGFDYKVVFEHKHALPPTESD